MNAYKKRRDEDFVEHSQTSSHAVQAASDLTRSFSSPARDLQQMLSDHIDSLPMPNADVVAARLSARHRMAIIISLALIIWLTGFAIFFFLVS